MSVSGVSDLTESIVYSCVRFCVKERKGRMKTIKWLKRIVLMIGFALFVLLGIACLSLGDEYEEMRRLRDFEFVRRMLDYDEGEEFQCQGIRTYHNDDCSHAYITLPDGQTVFMACFVELGGTMYGGYKDGYYYAAKPVNGGWQIQRQNENVLRRQGMPPRVSPADDRK